MIEHCAYLDKSYSQLVVECSRDSRANSFSLLQFSTIFFFTQLHVALEKNKQKIQGFINFSGNSHNHRRLGTTTNYRLQCALLPLPSRKQFHVHVIWVTSCSLNAFAEIIYCRWYNKYLKDGMHGRCRELCSVCGCSHLHVWVSWLP